MKKIKIAYFIQDLDIGGAEKLLLDLINNLDNNLFEIILITLTNEGLLFNQITKKISKVYSTKNIFKLIKILKNEKPQILHSHLWRADFLGVILAKLSGIDKHFTTKHNTNYFYGIKKILTIFDAILLRFTTTVITNSKSVHNYYNNNFLYFGINFKMIYNGLDYSELLKLEYKKNYNKKIYFLTVANLIKQKGHLEFLDILKKFSNLDYEWHLIGNGPLKNKILKKIKNLNLENKVILHLKQENLKDFYKKADIFLLPSLWEGFGLVILEAYAASVPVFASNVDGIKEIVIDNKTGILFNWSNKLKIEQKFKNLIENQSLRDNLILNAKEKLKEFSIEKFTKKYTNLYLNS